MPATKDPEYDYIEPLPQSPFGFGSQKRGVQCGECGIKFDYDKTYGYACGNPRCPTGHGNAR